MTNQVIKHKAAKKSYFDGQSPVGWAIIDRLPDPSMEYACVKIDDIHNTMDSPYSPTPIKHGDLVLIHEVDIKDFTLYENKVICLALKGQHNRLNFRYCYSVHPGANIHTMTFTSKEKYNLEDIPFTQIEAMFLVDKVIVNPKLMEL